jgi:hypothetical protein
VTGTDITDIVCKGVVIGSLTTGSLATAVRS